MASEESELVPGCNDCFFVVCFLFGGGGGGGGGFRGRGRLAK